MVYLTVPVCVTLYLLHISTLSPLSHRSKDKPTGMTLCKVRIDKMREVLLKALESLNIFFFTLRYI